MAISLEALRRIAQRPVAHAPTSAQLATLCVVARRCHSHKAAAALARHVGKAAPTAATTLVLDEAVIAEVASHATIVPLTREQELTEMQALANRLGLRHAGTYLDWLIWNQHRSPSAGPSVSRMADAFDELKSGGLEDMAEPPDRAG